MAYQTIEIRPDDGEAYKLEVTARDALMWERTGRDNPSILDYLRRPSMIETYRIAHIVARREQRFGGSLKEFEANHDVVIVISQDDYDEPDPTESAASTAD